MNTNCKPMGNYIRLVDERNSKSITDKVLGISIDKIFMPSVANVIGTDLSKYKLLRKGLFACNPMHVGRDERLPVALYKEEEFALVSPAYFMFEIYRKDELDDDYLMMWFRRKEFDRICWLKTDGSVRGGIAWEDICRMEIPVPDICEQRRIVDNYNVITERIKLKQKINDNLLSILQALYKSWFMDYEPFDRVRPSDWTEGCVENIAEFYDSMRKPLSGEERKSMERIYPYYGAVSIVDYVDNYIFDGEYLLLSEDGIYVVDDNGHPLLQHVRGKFWVNNHAHVLKGKAGFNEDSLYMFLQNTNMLPIVTGAAQPKINQANLKSFPVIIPDNNTILRFNSLIEPLFEQKLNNISEINRLEEIKSLLLADLAH